jgi:hypothetical protein
LFNAVPRIEVEDAKTTILAESHDRRSPNREAPMVASFNHRLVARETGTHGP